MIGLKVTLPCGLQSEIAELNWYVAEIVITVEVVFAADDGKAVLLP